LDIVNPEMLVLARESRLKTQTELAREVTVTQGKISKYENGFLLVSEQDLMRIARALRYTPDFFYQHPRLYGLGSTTLFHRQRQGIPILLQKRIQAETNILRLQVERLLQSVELEHDNTFEPLDIDAFDGNAAEIARLVRAGWRLPTGPLSNLTSAIESAGGIVLKCSFRVKQIDAVHMWVPGLPPLFFLNRDLSGDRLRFTLGHEVGHAIMHRVPAGDIESEADRFASELLMPEKEIGPALTGLTLQRAAALKPIWKVSIAALIRRARDLHKITDSQYRRMFVRLSAQGYRAQEPFPIAVEEPTTVRELVGFHKTTLGYSDQDLARLLFTTDPQFLESTVVPVELRIAGIGRPFFSFRECLKRESV
jgi:Zn-dependent peptidase ImmA (M78 family)